MKDQSTRKLEKDLLKLHTKYFTDTDNIHLLQQEVRLWNYYHLILIWYN